MRKKYNLQEAVDEVLDSYYREIKDQEKKAEETMLKEVSKIVSRTKYRKIVDYIELNSDYTWNFEIVNKFRGEKQTEGGLVVYINQTTNGGYTGDEFAGEAYIKIGRNRFLKYNYVC